MPLQLTVVSRGKPVRGLPLEVNLVDGATLLDLKQSIAKIATRLSVDRQRITTENKSPLLDDTVRLVDLGVRNGDRLYVKDLGPQIGWRTVFFVEYAGPLFIHPLLYYAAPIFWSRFGYTFDVSLVQTTTLVMVMLHFIKREAESLWVHRFSNSTMPLFNIFKNSTHYWLLSGVLLGTGVYSPFLGQSVVEGTLRDNHVFIGTLVTVWAIAELCNLYTHLILMNLRPKGTRVRQIPRGFAFELVSCPNYFFEVVAWASVTVMTLSLSSLTFTLVSAAQMTVWAIKKHKAYRREFGSAYPARRRVMYPFIF
ncbi:very-long-chain enoyl-CoA reductase [Malassezia cuniculi]|uniref:Very-long-chain enoyl-CoA reductase n=1 Tax=Malassezia cuniculi TaxID=948313 RepID=A0AAF0ENQ5_9BASI|nr:very-long-chain enoyl-CoA reductase [Malassezia cuniculi]